MALVVWEGGEPRQIGGRELLHGGQHGAQLPCQIEALLEERGVGQEALQGCSVGVGPGSFTGLRVGMATLKGICFARRIPLQGASTLGALALRAAEGTPGGALLCPLLDARRGEVYAGVFRSLGNVAGSRGIEPIGPEVSLPPDRLAEWLAGVGAFSGDRPRLFGEGLHAQQGQLESALADRAILDLAGPRSPAAFDIARLAGPPRPFALDALFAIEPRYVRPSQAELKFPDGNFIPRTIEG